MVALSMFEGERVELLHGTVVQIGPHGPLHDETVDALDDRLARQLGGRAKVRVQSSFAASDGSEPEPDIAVVPAQSYRTAHPDRAFLIVEVADSSLRKDRGVKARLYAESAVDEYWVVDLEGRAVHVYRDPQGGRYASESTRGAGETLRLERLPDVTVSIDDILSA